MIFLEKLKSSYLPWVSLFKGCEMGMNSAILLTKENYEKQSQKKK